LNKTGKLGKSAAVTGSRFASKKITSIKGTVSSKAGKVSAKVKNSKLTACFKSKKNKQEANQSESWTRHRIGGPPSQGLEHALEKIKNPAVNKKDQTDGKVSPDTVATNLFYSD
tara:strand:- start:321 stop:662 length:342 start_codon:yes stop_codon:yes gene_type:complete